MKSKIIVVLFAVCLVSTSAGAIDIIPGSVAGDWYAFSNPYNIQGEIFVPAGETLVIHPGVEVVFKGHHKLIVNGILQAVGTETQPILFTTPYIQFGWNGIRFIDAPAGSRLTHCIIEHGRATGSNWMDPEGWGGGVLCYNSSPMISNCTFSENTAYGLGGGIMCYGSGIELTECTFSNNSAYVGGGGVAYQADPVVLVSCDIVDNTAGDTTAGFHFWDSIAIVDDCTVTGNISERWGGGLGAGALGHVTVRHSTISGNTAELWGAGIAAQECTVAITNNTITGNIATGQRGGGFYAYLNCDGTVADNIITDNRAELSGGGIVLWDHCSMDITNNLICGNAAGNGGGIWCDASSSTVANNTILKNSATVNGGGIALMNGSTLTIANSILWSNDAGTRAEEIAIFGNPTNPSKVVVNYTDLRGGRENTIVAPGCILKLGDGMIDEDPLFCSLEGGGDHCNKYLSHLACGGSVDSPCIDAGNPASDPLKGSTRVDLMQDDGTVDMGFHYPTIVLAELSCTPSSGNLPFDTRISVSLFNCCPMHERRIAASLDLQLACGLCIENWRSGTGFVAGGERHPISWIQTVPAMDEVHGENIIRLVAEDVTPPPYNQPPYMPSGNTDTIECTIVGKP